MIMSLFKPDMHVRCIEDIDFCQLWTRGIRGLAFDLDNTLVPWRAYDKQERIISWFKSLQQQGFAVCVLSNGRKEKVDLLSSWLDIPVFGDSRKPARSAFVKASQTLKLAPRQLAMIGDQLLTDIYGGNKAGFYTILTDIIDENEFWGTRHLARPLERLIKHLCK